MVAGIQQLPSSV